MVSSTQNLNPNDVAAVRRHSHVLHFLSQGRMPGLDPIRACRKILDLKGSLRTSDRVIGILDGKPMSLHERMHAALHDDVTAVPGESDGIACPQLGQRRAMEHDEDMIAIPSHRSANRARPHPDSSPSEDDALA